jgi:uncharacterized protein (TIGR03435 family)
MRIQPRFAVLAATTLVGIMNAQSPPQGPASTRAGKRLEFEVASIRPAAQPPGGRPCTGTSTTDAGRVARGCVSLEGLLHRIIGIPEYKLVAPDWISQSDPKFDISAKLPDGATQDQIPDMFLSLLEDRFGLVFHREARERPILALVVAKGGLKVQPAAPESAQPAWVAAAAKVPAASRRFFAPTRNFNFSVQGSDGEQMSIIQSPSMGFVWRSVRESDKMIRYEAPSITSEGLADLVAVASANYRLDEEIRDMTGLKGRYQVIFDISSDWSAGIAAQLGTFKNGQDFLDAQQDAQFRGVQDGLKKLGLQLEPRKAPVEMFVIDHLEKTPTQN